MDQIMECIPNFSEGRDFEKVEKIAGAFRAKEAVKLLDYSTDKDHNRCVITAVGSPEALRDAVIEAIGIAVSLIDLTTHDGQHPRMGAADVVPFVPVRGCTLEDADRIAKETAAAVADRYALPVFLYEKSASAPHRENLAAIRKGQFEGMAEKMKNPLWRPDFGPDTVHPTAGVTAIGARMPLVAFNINLNTPDLRIADEIAHRIRHINGGFRFVKSMGVLLEDRNIAQVSINMTDYTKTSLYRVFETVKMEARRWGVSVVGSEIIGLTPMAALVDCAEYYLRIENFRMDQILETRL
ncbi:glutamate formimidoyltransferase [uncultured Oscillibacter sp.]|uniref:glutamate formimidoyltransferase n=1 Tax=uncultured Oscillibacter sp. TaxID=876091 RepID=UPI0025F0A257|nr:glutamate formimidoyltransferase [uncultured Oscillibacter sp.]